MSDRATLAAIVSAVVPVDAVEVEHQTQALRWIDSGASLYRLEKPARPPEHLVAYVVLVDADDAAVYLVDHRNARLWLPTGGHVEPGEDPLDTAHRELREELGVETRPFAGLSSNPIFITRTTTVGEDVGHVDVSLWYPFEGSRAMKLVPDEREFVTARWWHFDEILGGPAATFDPHLPRFVKKLRRELLRRSSVTEPPIRWQIGQ